MDLVSSVTNKLAGGAWERALDLNDSSFADMLHQATFMLDENDPDAPDNLAFIGALFFTRYEVGHRAADLDRAISHFEKSVRLTPDFDADQAGHLEALGVATITRSQVSGDMFDLDTACFCFENSLLIQPEGPETCSVAENLAVALKIRFERLGNLEDVDKAITTLQQVLDNFSDTGVERASPLGNLGNALESRFDRLGNLSDLDNAIDAKRKAVELTPEGHPNKPSWLSNLGSALQTRFDRLGNLSDLESAIEAKRKAVELTPEGHPDKPGWLNNLGNALQTRFNRLGSLSDLENAIDAKRKAVELTPEGHPDKPGWLNNLGNALETRFDRLGNLPDLENAIDAKRKAVELTPEGHPDRPGRLSNLGNALETRFDRLGNLSDLESAIDVERKAVELTPDGHPDEPTRLSSLGSALETRWRHLGNLSDLQSAADAKRNAVELTPDGHPDKPGWLNNLGKVLLLRFRRLADTSDLEGAIRSFGDAVNFTPDGHPGKQKYLNGLAQSLLESGTTADMNKGLHALRASVEYPLGNPRQRLRNAMSWAELCRMASDEQQTLRAYACAMSLIPRAAWMGLAVEGRHEMLGQIRDLVSEAAAAATRNGQPDQALEWLEQGRSVVWGQTLQLRSPVDSLRDRDSARADRLTEISRILEANSKDENLSAEENGRQLRALSLEWEEHLAEVRKLDGLEDFLGPKKVAQLLPAASISPIVVLNAHKEGCDALVLMAHADEVIHIPLLFTSQRAEELADSLEKARYGRSVARHTHTTERHLEITGEVKQSPEERVRELLAELWKNVVGPVLEALAFSIPENTDCELPRVCWCPTGSLAFLPLHAAGLYDTDELGTKAFDFVISSYTPTVTALLQSPLDQDSQPKILAVAQTTYTGSGVAPLPQTKQELEHIRSRAKSNSIDVVEAQDGAGTVERILKGMSNCNWLHLACHGVQDLHTPTKSAFILADGRLTLEEIIKHPLPHAEFAFLSACQTAAGDAKLLAWMPFIHMGV